MPLVDQGGTSVYSVTNFCRQCEVLHRELSAAYEQLHEAQAEVGRQGDRIAGLEVEVERLRGVARALASALDLAYPFLDDYYYDERVATALIGPLLDQPLVRRLLREAGE